MNKTPADKAENKMETDSRRKIIKGLASLPAVLTIGPATGAPAASAYECAVAPADGGRNHLSVNTADNNNALAVPDVQLTSKLNGSSTFNANCVPETQVTPSAEPGLPGYFDNGFGSPVRLGGSGSGNNKACVVFVDSMGNQHLTYNGNNLPVAASCLVSVVTFTPKV